MAAVPEPVNVVDEPTQALLVPEMDGKANIVIVTVSENFIVADASVTFLR